ncbi:MULTISPECIES: sce7725 family protein [Burkholderia]|uniref:sce7725 family protein n=1 Tax=Burkholderia TaxID=32008 RepID=UPI001592D03D|nr:MULTISPECIES: sce7725 family protein [Burkholderia]MDA0573256.1 sce7725 family protein [Burkholderia gladioli]MDA0601430.1 sce7725 family protein [Burkholderia gladioli]NVE22835.1 sce7725 family protein [Burkholderia glumae]
MYFPYLYARRSELLALRDAVEDLPIQATVVPILEPVKANSGDLIRCLRVLAASEVQTIVITNPYQGDFRNGGVDAWRASLQDQFARQASLLPGFICRQHSTAREVERFLAQYPDRDVALLYSSPRLSDAEVRALVGQRRIRFHINLHDRMSAVQRGLLPRTKAVDIRDNFNALDRNADYDGSEFFTDRHLTFAENAVGYGDYSIIGATFREGGGQPHAVAIHSTYKQGDTGQLWVEHFVSDDIERNVGTVEEKFQQAATKLVRAVGRRPAEFGDNGALRAQRADVRARHFPGLGENKRRQIHHHIAVNHHSLVGAL